MDDIDEDIGRVQYTGWRSELQQRLLDQRKPPRVPCRSRIGQRLGAGSWPAARDHVIALRASGELASTR